jgi:hypothetical protein
VVYLIVRQVEDQIVMPVVIGRAVHLHPVVTIFAVLVGLSAFGVLGGLLGVPVAAALNVTLHELYPETGGPVDHQGRGFRLGLRLPRFRRAAAERAAPEPRVAGRTPQARPRGRAKVEAPMAADAADAAVDGRVEPAVESSAGRKGKAGGAGSGRSSGGRKSGGAV